METVLFDTHAYIKKLEASGIAHAQAEAHSEALAEAFRGGVATKSDLKDVEVVLRSDMQKMETGLRNDMQKMESGLRNDMQKMETGLRNDMQKLENIFRSEFNSLLKWTIPLIVGLFAAQTAFFARMIH